jgi:hypothetical protein
MPDHEIVPQAPATLTTKAWVATVTTQRHLRLQGRIITFLLWAYGSLLATAMTIFFLQGFHLWGFALDLKILGWLGGATIGEIGGLLLLTFRVVFGNSRK